MTGVCPTCSKEFYSKQQKIFCCHKCYTNSESFKLRMQSHRDKKVIEGNFITNCNHCNKTLKLRKSRGKGMMGRFCNRLCYREYLACRFDQAVASPELLPLPQNYDEFLTQEKLPCLVLGCNWVGHNLAIHCNLAHNITAEQLKEMAGFNVCTGLVSPSLSVRLGQTAKSSHREDNLSGVKAGQSHPNNIAGWKMRAEGKEHMFKSKVLKKEEDCA